MTTRAEPFYCLTPWGNKRHIVNDHGNQTRCGHRFVDKLDAHSPSYEELPVCKACQR